MYDDAPPMIRPHGEDWQLVSDWLASGAPNEDADIAMVFLINPPSPEFFAKVMWRYLDSKGIPRITKESAWTAFASKVQQKGLETPSREVFENAIRQNPGVSEFKVDGVEYWLGVTLR